MKRKRITIHMRKKRQINRQGLKKTKNTREEIGS
jgi:hypothetical protein